MANYLEVEHVAIEPVQEGITAIELGCGLGERKNSAHCLGDARQGYRWSCAFRLAFSLQPQKRRLLVVSKIKISEYIYYINLQLLDIDVDIIQKCTMSNL